MSLTRQQYDFIMKPILMELADGLVPIGRGWDLTFRRVLDASWPYREEPSWGVRKLRMIMRQVTIDPSCYVPLVVDTDGNAVA